MSPVVGNFQTGVIIIENKKTALLYFLPHSAKTRPALPFGKSRALPIKNLGLGPGGYGSDLALRFDQSNANFATTMTRRATDKADSSGSVRKPMKEGREGKECGSLVLFLYQTSYCEDHI
jgi:hypothetical protein